MKTLLVIVLAFFLTQQPTPLERIQTIQEQLDQLRIDLTPPAPPIILPVATEAELDLRIANASIGEDIILDPKLVYTKLLTIKKSVTLEFPVPSGRMDTTQTLPIFKDGIIISGNDVVLRGLEVHKLSPNYPVIEVQAGTQRISLDRNRILGDPVKGARKGIVGNAAFLSVIHNYVKDCFGPYPGNDTQALSIYDTPGPGEILDNYFEGGTEVLMFGGSDSVHIPSDYTIIGNTFTHRPEQQTQPISLKNIVEFKNIRRALFQHNIVQYSWGGHGQTGYAFAITPRNQNGAAPQSTVEDLTINDNDIAHAAGAFTILSADDRTGFQSARLTRFKVTNNRFTDMDPVLWAGDNKLILIASSQYGSINGMTFDSNVFNGKNIGSWLYFTTKPPHESMIITNNTIPPSKYGVFSSVGAALTWSTYVLSGSLTNNVVVP